MFDLYRAYLPAAYGRGNFGPLPMLKVMTAPDVVLNLIHEVGGSVPDYMDARSTCFWFEDRESWRAAWRMARKIARGGATLHELQVESEIFCFVFQTCPAHLGRVA